MININKHRNHTDLIIEFKIFNKINHSLMNKKTFIFCLALSLGFGFGIAIFNEPQNLQKAEQVSNLILENFLKQGDKLANARF